MRRGVCVGFWNGAIWIWIGNDNLLTISYNKISEYACSFTKWCYFLVLYYLLYILTKAWNSVNWRELLITSGSFPVHARMTCKIKIFAVHISYPSSSWHWGYEIKKFRNPIQVSFIRVVLRIGFEVRSTFDSHIELLTYRSERMKEASIRSPSSHSHLLTHWPFEMKYVSKPDSKSHS